MENYCFEVTRKILDTRKNALLRILTSTWSLERFFSFKRCSVLPIPNIYQDRLSDSELILVNKVIDMQIVWIRSLEYRYLAYSFSYMSILYLLWSYIVLNFGVMQGFIFAFFVWIILAFGCTLYRYKLDE